jgi:hypothetical protein
MKKSCSGKTERDTNRIQKERERVKSINKVWADRVAQVVECLLSKGEALSSNLVPQKTTIKKKLHCQDERSVQLLFI